MITARDVAADFAKGAVAGILATWIMGKVTSAVYALERESAREQEKAKGPTHFPWQAHARGLVGHLAYGVAAETTLDALDRVA